MAKSAQRKNVRTSTARKAAKPAAGRKGAAKRAGGGRAAGRKTAARKGGARRGTANAAFMRPVTPSSALAEVVGAQPLPRTELTKRLWAYIKRNRLQDADNRRQINADDKLKAIFGGRSSVNMFEMTRLVNKQVR